MAMSVKVDAVEATRGFRVSPATVALALVLLITTILKFSIYAGQNLNIDEVWTGMIAGQRSVAGLVRQCEIEVNGPLSYVIAWLWAPFGGLSNTGLRLPSALFACATPFVALAPRRLMPPTARFVWAALLACWLPEFAFAQLARCYALVALLATANTVAYARLLSRPSLAAAAVWSLISALLILDHYFAVILIGCQGLGYLALKRGRALRTWPAALIFIPALADIALKAATLSHFATPGVSWIDRLTVGDLPNLVAFLAGNLLFAAVIAVALAIGWFLDGRRSRPPEASGPADGRDALVTAAALAALATAISIGLGFMFPILTSRYLTVEVPGLMLALALMAERFSRTGPLLSALIVGSAISLVIGLAAHIDLVTQPAVTAFSFEPAAKALIADNPRRLVFFWDTPQAQGGDQDQLAQVGEFFFRRAGHPIPIDAVSGVHGADPNTVLLARAAAPGTDILWMFDRDAEGTAAVDHPPDISRRDPRWSCRDFGEGDIGILACRRARA